MAHVTLEAPPGKRRGVVVEVLETVLSTSTCGEHTLAAGETDWLRARYIRKTACSKERTELGTAAPLQNESYKTSTVSGILRLRRILRAAGLPTTGTQPVLATRIQQAAQDGLLGPACGAVTVGQTGNLTRRTDCEQGRAEAMVSAVQNLLEESGASAYELQTDISASHVSELRDKFTNSSKGTPNDIKLAEGSSETLSLNERKSTDLRAHHQASTQEPATDVSNATLVDTFCEPPGVAQGQNAIYNFSFTDTAHSNVEDISAGTDESGHQPQAASTEEDETSGARFIKEVDVPPVVSALTRHRTERDDMVVPGTATSAFLDKRLQDNVGRTARADDLPRASGRVAQLVAKVNNRTNASQDSTACSARVAPKAAKCVTPGKAATMPSAHPTDENKVSASHDVKDEKRRGKVDATKRQLSCGRGATDTSSHRSVAVSTEPSDTARVATQPNSRQIPTQTTRNHSGKRWGHPRVAPLLKMRSTSAVPPSNGQSTTSSKRAFRPSSKTPSAACPSASKDGPRQGWGPPCATPLMRGASARRHESTRSRRSPPSRVIDSRRQPPLASTVKKSVANGHFTTPGKAQKQAKQVLLTLTPPPSPPTSESLEQKTSAESGSGSSRSFKEGPNPLLPVRLFITKALDSNSSSSSSDSSHVVKLKSSVNLATPHHKAEAATPVHGSEGERTRCAGRSIPVYSKNESKSIQVIFAHGDTDTDHSNGDGGSGKREMHGSEGRESDDSYHIPKDSSSESEGYDEDSVLRILEPSVVPEWASEDNVAKAMERQYGRDCPINPNQIFVDFFTCNLENIFDTRKKKWDRKSTGDWMIDRLTIAEKLAYDRAMGYVSIDQKRMSTNRGSRIDRSRPKSKYLP